MYEKNCGTARLIMEQNSLKKELEHTRIEKDTMERLLHSKDTKEEVLS